MDGLVTSLGQNYGVLGLLLAISLSLNFWLLKMLLTEKDKRIEEASKVTENIAQPLKLLQQSVDLQTAKIQEAKSR